MADQAERLRQLIRTSNKAHYLKTQQKPSRFIAVASGKGGVGKSNFVVNASLTLDQWGKKVIIIDADLGMANIDILLGLKPKATLWHVIRGEKRLEEVMINGPGNLKIISGGSGFFELANLDSVRRNRLLESFTLLQGDLVFIDCAAGISRNVLGFIAACDELLVVVTPEPTSIADAYGMLKVITERGLRPRLYLLVNRAADHREGEDVYRRIKYTCARFLDIEPHYLGIVNDDHLVRLSVQRSLPFVLSYPDSEAAINLRRAVRSLLDGGEDPKEIKGSGISEFLSRLFRIGSRVIT
ncbi:MAG: MinD/ParA family protein [Dethiobacteria bacterium]|jgi:flagellar biosynthesis protein FlhG